MKELKNLKVDELKAMAREHNIKGWWDMKKADLIEAIENATQIAPVEPEIVEEEKTNNSTAEAKNAPEVKSDKTKNRGKLIECDGKAQTLSAWAKELGVKPQTLYGRLYVYGWSVRKALGKKPIKREVTTEDE